MFLKIVLLCLLVCISAEKPNDYIDRFLSVRPEYWRWLVYGATPGQYIPDANPSSLRNESWYPEFFPKGYSAGDANHLMVTESDILFVNDPTLSSSFLLKTASSPIHLSFDTTVVFSPTEKYIIVRNGNICQQRQTNMIVQVLVISRVGAFEYRSLGDIVIWDYRELKLNCTTESYDGISRMRLSRSQSSTLA